MLLQLCLYFSVQIETENYKLIFEFRHFIKWGKICITFGIFYDQLSASTPIFQLFFDFSLLEWRVVKKRAAIFV